MWPWEHLAFGYLLYSLARRAGDGPPDDAAVVALAFGTQFPDVVDKPLTWTFGVLPGGTFAHTVFVAGPVVAGVLVWQRRGAHGRVGTGFSAGYLSHLAGDAVYPLAFGDLPEAGRFLWPLVPSRPSPRPGLLDNLAYYLSGLLRQLTSPEGAVLAAFEVGLLATALALWAVDGTPGATPVGRLVGRATGSDDSGRP